MKKILTYIIILFTITTLIYPATTYRVFADDEETEETEIDPKAYQPNFENLETWGDNSTINPYTQSGWLGQCTWFAWCCMNEFYDGYLPPFSSDGMNCASQLVANDPEHFSMSDTPKAGSIASSVPNHVAFVSYVYEDGTFDLWEGNIKGWPGGGTLEQVLSQPNYRFLSKITIQGYLEAAQKTSVEFAVPTDEFLKTAKFDAPSYKNDQEREQDLTRKGILKKEWEIKGMPPKSPMMNETLPLPWLTESKDLTAQEQIRVAKLKESIKLEKQANYRRMFSSMISMVGLLLSVYSILLLVAFYFDKSNVFLNFSLVSLLSFGKLRIEDDNFGYRGTIDGARHMSSKDFHIFVFGLLAFSILWTAGWIQKVSIFILDKILSFF